MEPNGPSTPPLPPRAVRTQSYDSPRPRFPRPQNLGRSMKESPRKPKNMGLFAPAGPRRQPSHPPSPPCKSKEDIQLEEQLEEIKRRMGTLCLQGGKTYHLQSRDDLEVVKKIGSGICGEVFLIKHKDTGFEMAAKKMVWLEDPQERRRILMDLRVMTSHHCPNIVQYYGSAIWNNEVWVFMELMTTCLDRLLKKTKEGIPEEIVCKMAMSIVKALAYLKSQHKVIHRDVKPSNMLLDTHGNVKLCDFGISGRLVDSQAFTRNAGCAAYMAPERINLQVGNKGYDVRADIWSLGISLVELATGASPYVSKNFRTEFELLTHIVEAPPPLPDRTRFSPNFYDFITQCLTKDVEKRPYYTDLLQHPLILEYQDKPVDIADWFAKVCRTHGLP